MKRMDRTALAVLKAEIEKALKPVIDTHGLAMSFKGGRFDELSYEPKIHFSIKDESGVDAAAKADWDRYCNWYGLKPEHFDQRVVIQGQAYVLSGINPGRPTYPISARRLDGRSFKFTESAIRRALGLPARA